METKFCRGVAAMLLVSQDLNTNSVLRHINST